MIKLFKKLFLYGALIFLVLEIIVRVFHLHNERPVRYLDDRSVEKWVPNQNEYAVTGNRRENVGEYRINSFGFNSVYDDYKAYGDSVEIALVGDSFIEGFHQNYENSLGQKIEEKLPGVRVFEFGYAGYDLADQLHMIDAYAEMFSAIDHIIIYVKYTDDLTRDSYQVSERLNSNRTLNRMVTKSKLLVYLKDIGLIHAFGTKVRRAIWSFKQGAQPIATKKVPQDSLFLQNFKELTRKYHFDKDRYILFTDDQLCSPIFLDYLDENGFKTIYFGQTLLDTKKPTTLIYDQHWNDFGRELLADLIVNYLKTKEDYNDFNHSF